MAMAQYLPVRPQNSVHLGENIFLQVGPYKGAILTHIRVYEPNAVLFVPTNVGVSYVWQYWIMLSEKFNKWCSDIELDRLEEGTLYGDAKSAVIYNNDPEEGKLIHFVLGSSKTITLNYEQFIKLCTSLPIIENYYEQMAQP